MKWRIDIQYSLSPFPKCSRQTTARNEVTTSRTYAVTVIVAKKGQLSKMRRYTATVTSLVKQKQRTDLQLLANINDDTLKRNTERIPKTTKSLRYSRRTESHPCTKRMGTRIVRNMRGTYEDNPRDFNLTELPDSKYNSEAEAP